MAASCAAPARRCRDLPTGRRSTQQNCSWPRFHFNTGQVQPGEKDRVHLCPSCFLRVLRVNAFSEAQKVHKGFTKDTEETHSQFTGQSFVTPKARAAFTMCYKIIFWIHKIFE